MAVLQTSSPFFSCCSSSTSFVKPKAALYNPNVSVPKLLNYEFDRRKGLKTFKTTNPTTMEINPKLENDGANKEEISNSLMLLQEMFAIMDIVADRVEIHKNIGAQRDNWNRLLLNSVNRMTVMAAKMAGIATVTGGGGRASFLGLKLSSSLLYLAATGVSLVMNKIQPSQLAEEQRNASRLFKQLHEEIKTSIAVGNLDSDDVKGAIEKVLALDEAYPLPLIGTMLNKFPSLVQPAEWWPKESTQQKKLVRKVERKNGWNENLEEEMKEIVGVLKRKDTEEYIRLSKVALKINKILAICGPLFTAIAAVSSALMGSSFFDPFAAISGVVFGAMAIVVNSLEHGGQIGMVFEMYRNSAGFFRLMGETIESTLEEAEADERENGELFEVKVALQLGRSVSELRDLADADDESHNPHSKTQHGDEQEFATEMALVLVLLFNSPIRKLVIKILDRIKEGKGPVISKTVAGTLFVVFISIAYNVIEIQKRSLEGGVLNPTDEVLLANRILEASLMGFALFLALVTYRLHYCIKDLQTTRRLEAVPEMKQQPDLNHHDLKDHPKKATASR